MPVGAHTPIEGRLVCAAEALLGHLFFELWLYAAIALVIPWYAWQVSWAVSCKVADDPSLGDGAQRVIDCLCTATRLLQIPQVALPRDFARLLQGDVFEDGLENLQPQDAAVTFAILAPEYAPEFVTVILQLPCTWREAELLLPSARATGPSVRFPHLHPVAQQHIPGFVILTAAPRWDPHATVVCLNSTEIDGRVFAAFAPSYVDREGLCRLAALPSGIDYDVFVDGDDQPMARDFEVHLSQGMQVIPARGHALPVLLLSSANWDETFAFPAPALYDSYCIATTAQHALCTCDFGRPWRMRRNIACTIGLAHQRFHVLPAKPPIRDIAIQGVKCRTLLAACSCEGQESNCQAFFLDLRPVQEGLRLRYCVGFALDLDLWVDTLSAEAPLGWCAQISDTPASFGGRVFLEPGTMLTVDYVPNHDPVDAVAGDRQEGGSHDPSDVVSSNNATLDTQGSSTGQETEQDPVPPAAESSDETDVTVGPNLRSRTFVILGQDYAPELIQVALPVPTSVFDALTSVSVARKPRDRFCLPHLLPVVPQPTGSHALILAMPPWQVDGAYIAFDLSTHDGRAFVLQAASRIDRLGLLIAAGLDARTNIDIYIRDMPWALPNDIFVEVGHGDLVQFVPVQQPVAVVASLADMLASPTHWRYVAPVLDMFLWDTWVVHDAGAFRHQVRPERRQQSKQDIAARLSILPNDLVVQLPKPRIQDFCRRDQLTMHVLYAVWAPGCPSADDLSEAVCFVDLRPVLCGLYVARCPGYRFDVRELLLRFAGRCPAGMHVQAERRGTLLPPDEQALPVTNGDVITVFVLPDALTREWGHGGGDPPGPSMPPDPPGPGEHDDDHTRRSHLP